MDGRWLPIRIVALALLALACAPPPAPSPAPPAASKPPAAATAPPPTTAPAAAPATPPPAPPARAHVEYMMIVPNLNYWHQFVAQELGFFDAQNLEVEQSYSETSSRLVQALASGSVHMGGPSPDAVINAVERGGGGLVIIAGELDKMAYSLVAARDVRTYADLRGKTLAAIGAQEGSTVVLRKMLGDHGLRPDEYSFVPVGGTANRAAAVQNGTAAAALIGQPQDFRLTAEGYPNLGNSYEVFPYYPLNVIATRRDWAQQNADVVVRFLRAIIQADRWLYDPANREAAANVAVNSARMTLEEGLRSYDLLVTQTQAIPREADLPLGGLQAVIETMAEVDLLSPPLPNPDKYVDLTYLERARR
jgi:ABC-type nitrate/sulfonate/bicarbonate transport system substrate-binding protein